MKVKEEWKQPVSGSDAWKSILFTLVVVCAIGTFSPILTSHRLQRPLMALALIVVWVMAAFQVSKVGWRNWSLVQTLFLVGYTLFAGGELLPQKAAIVWLTNIGCLLFACAMALTVFDFGKRRSSPSADAMPPVQEPSHPFLE